MSKFAVRVLSLSMLWIGIGVRAQVPFPPPALISAPSVEAAAVAVGSPSPEFSSYLLLDVPEISAPGMVDAVISSELPGTTHLVLLRQFPVSPTAPAQPGVRKATPKVGTAGGPGRSAAAPPPAMQASPSVLISAVRLAPGAPPMLKARFNFQRNERFTMLVFAQGRWFATSREVKLARPVSERIGAAEPTQRSVTTTR